MLVTIPTLGTRINSLKFTLASIREFIPFAEIEIRTPNAKLESEIIHYLDDKTRVVVDDAEQALAIINSWSANTNNWCTWINDDDFALYGFFAAISLMSKFNFETKPLVIYGDLVIMSKQKTYRIKTPKRISKWLLSAGTNYIPGILTVVNAEAVKIITQSSLKEGLLRNSFDYQWWLQLTDANALFRHTGACHAAWRDHPGARTKVELTFSKLETAKLKNFHASKISKYKFAEKINSFSAKVVAKILSLRN